MQHLVAAIIAMLTLSGAAQAATVTIDFDELADDSILDPRAGTGQVGNVLYVDENCRNFDNCLPFIGLSDDGYYNSTTFTASSGTTFTPLSIQLTGATNLVGAPTAGLTDEEIADLESDCVEDGDCPGAVPVGFDNILISGFDAVGNLMAQDLVGSPGASFSGVYAFSPDFADITSLTIEILYVPTSGLPPGQVYGCGSLFYAGCVSGSVDNFKVEVAFVPLSASFAPFFLALGALGLIRRRNARS